MYVNRHKYFRWTPRTAWMTFAYVVVVPSIVGYVAFTSDVSYKSYFSMVQICEAVWRSLEPYPGLLPFIRIYTPKSLRNEPIYQQHNTPVKKDSDENKQGKYEFRGKRRGDTIKEF
jgi:hypothetical protein